MDVAVNSKSGMFSLYYEDLEQIIGLISGSFQSFSGFVENFNNFHLYFIDSEFTRQTYRLKDYFKRFQKEYESLELFISATLTSFYRKGMNNWSKLTRYVAPQLYFAYLVLRSYGIEDSELFK